MSFADNFWGGKPKSGAQILFERCEEGREVCNEIILYTQQRIAIEKEYAKQLEQLSKKTPIGGKEIGTLAAAVAAIPKETFDTAKAHFEFAQRLNNDIVTPFGVFLKTNEQMSKMCTQDALKHHSDVATIRNRVMKAKEKYENRCRESDLAEMEIDKAALLKKSNSDVAKMRKKLDKMRKELDSLEREYSDGVDRLRGQLTGLVTGMRKVFGDVQKLEEARISYIKGAINKYMVSCQFKMSKMDESCQAIYAVEQQVNPQADIALFVEKFRTGTEPPQEPDVKFVKHIPYSERGSAAYQQQQQQQQNPSLQTQSSFNAGPPGGGGGGAPPPPMGGPPMGGPPPMGGGFGNSFSTNDYGVPPPGSVPDFMAPPSGDFGAPPPDFGAPPPPPPDAAPPAPGSGSQWVRAIYDYAAAQEGEVSFSAGDQIELVAENADGWWEGIINGQRGYFPGSYVEYC